MSETAQSYGQAEFERRLAQLRGRIDDLRTHLPDTSDDDRESLLMDLESAHEELRVADEEIRVQQDELDFLTEQQRISRWQHERLVALLPTALLVTDMTGNILTANPSAEALLMVSAGHLRRKPMQVFVGPTDRGPIRRGISDLADGQPSFRRRVSMVPRHSGPIQVDLVATVSQGVVYQRPEVSWLLFATPSDQPATDRDVVRLATGLVELTKVPLHATDAASTIRRAAGICADALGPDSAVSLTIGEPAAPEVLATASQLAAEIDGAQMRAGEGPCQSAWEQDRRVVSTALSSDPRWPRLAQQLAGDVRIAGAIAVPIRAGDRLIGVLNLYLDSTAAALDERKSTATQHLADAVAALLLEIESKAELETLAGQYRECLQSRSIIDQAKGIIMVNRGCGPDEAFAVLSRMSQQTNTKVRELAGAIVRRAAEGTPTHHPSTRH